MSGRRAPGRVRSAGAPRKVGAHAPRHVALWLSAAMPGLGQFSQRRLAPGLVYLVGFLVPFVVVLALVSRAMLQTFRAAMAFVSGEPDLPFAKPPMGLIFALVGVALLVYGISLADTWAAERAEAERARLRALEAKIKDAERGSGPEDEGKETPPPLLP